MAVIGDSSSANRTASRHAPYLSEENGIFGNGLQEMIWNSAAQALTDMPVLSSTGSTANVTRASLPSPDPAHCHDKQSPF